MINVIKNLISKWACCHEWYVHCYCTIRDEFGGKYRRDTLICKKCGKIKMIRV